MEQNEYLYWITEILRVDVIYAFGLYSIVLFSLRLILKRKTFLNQLDQTACWVVITAGIIFTIVWLVNLLLSYLQLETDLDKAAFEQRMFGKYWLGYWLQPVFWIALTQLLWFNSIRKRLLFRMIISFFMLLSFERIVIIITSLHRDYLPSSWSLGIGLTFWDVLLNILLKTTFFTVLVLVIHFVPNAARLLVSRKTQ